uniref:Uncharacterized protein n=1 Tax=Arundo donax TaxID=35708 RepID=A0A0A8ZV50_ARUDO
MQTGQDQAPTFFSGLKTVLHQQEKLTKHYSIINKILNRI